MMSRNTRTLLALAGAVALVFNLAGCPKPAPPPPPPPAPAPPPPPPQEVTLDTLAQEIKPDPRVQFASGLVVTEDQLELGKAVIRLADALAKGDDVALRPMLTRKAQKVLADLKGIGAWDEETKKIEAVRVILVSGGMDLSGVGKSVSSDPDSAFASALGSLPEAQRDALKPVFDALPKDAALAEALKAALPGAIEALKAAGVSQEVIDEMSKQLDGLTGAAAQGSGSSTGVLMAIQDSAGAYLLAWGAESVDGTWVFANAPSSPQLRTRASSFDGIGQEGFREVTLAAAVSESAVRKPAPADAAPGGEGSPGGSTPASPGSEPAPPPPPPSGPGGPRSPGGPGGGGGG